MVDALRIQPLTSSGFAPFGDVVEFEGHDSFPINKGMADRYHALADVELVGEQARAIISLVDSREFDMPRKVDHLEYHPLGSQAFLPLDANSFIVVVAPAANEPDLGKLAAFVTNGRQGINYRLGTWHHVLLTPYAAMRFICVDRTGPGDNCIDFFIPESDQLLLELP
ncbi:MAG: ureidoglycolate lyase [Gammaproteobacteria bacterium]|nr:ureidoglycolate lyase [Gammaproteobacteria bacterium]